MIDRNKWKPWNRRSRWEHFPEITSEEADRRWYEQYMRMELEDDEIQREYDFNNYIEEN